MSAVSAEPGRNWRGGVVRWTACLLAVVLVHGAAMLRLREIKPAAVAVNAPPAVELDLAPLPAPPVPAPPPPAPTPAVAAEPPPPAPQPPDPTPPDPTPQDPTPPEPVMTEPEPPPLPEPPPPKPEEVPPDLALPRPPPPKRPPRPVRAHPRPVETPVRTETPRPAPPVPVQAAPPPAAVSPGAAAASWESAVAAYLARFKRYPLSAQRRGEQGIAMVRFSVDRAGAVHAVALARSSGHPDLDREAQDLVDRAQPLPKPPAEVSGTAIDVEVPIRFALQ